MTPELDWDWRVKSLTTMLDSSSDEEMEKEEDEESLRSIPLTEIEHQLISVPYDLGFRPSSSEIKIVNIYRSESVFDCENLRNLRRGDDNIRLGLGVSGLAQI
ncbi:hypothetical protein HYC85_010043 [Camellia sinensis]|uniref:Uncharacterized protein n=1 Tax=Camellia sinensis TaxID=4442 RepID=A0A7J7HHB7_CAMSI|nr:hypothetical protein HYC85_010043 [Camellia sinensis]